MRSRISSRSHSGRLAGGSRLGSTVVRGADGSTMVRGLGGSTRLFFATAIVSWTSVSKSAFQSVILILPTPGLRPELVGAMIARQRDISAFSFEAHKARGWRRRCVSAPPGTSPPAPSGNNAPAARPQPKQKLLRSGDRFGIRKSSITLPAARSSFNQRGCLPRPDHVIEGFLGF